MMNDRDGKATEMMTLDRLPEGKSATIIDVGSDSLSLKLMEMGLIPGKMIKMIKRASYGDPMAIRYGDTTLALRRNEAQKVRIKPTTT